MLVASSPEYQSENSERDFEFIGGLRCDRCRVKGGV
jgi:hypothetical protein